MNKFDKIYLSWRVSKGYPRIIVGEILPKAEDVNFKYSKEGLNEAKRYGFVGYPGLKFDEMEHKNVLNLLSKRLINTDRSDAGELLDFWNIEHEYKDNKLYVLAMTQGMTPTDNFEFLANFKLEKELCFVTDIAALTYSKFDLCRVSNGTQLTFEKENLKEDEFAVKVLFNNDYVGYIKKGHNMVFHDPNFDKLRLEVKHVSKENNQLFVRVNFNREMA
ncbi:MAG: hypothetical protein EZS26_002210 [Candidatus Ordinivivax streblomastigis]|uniref:Uncharacterized protein n=1 Tax=Candidatus Ordinivivax streblomastigis TaxID=2540710 RepID=A0A5M8NZM9_9BACT|nr:MAG: hypothetical protein EZS26_002210 [Candidatus Ordinivivax streblomastigis]